MDIGKNIPRGIELYVKNFVLLVLSFLVVSILSCVTLGILAGPLLGGFIVLCLKLLRGEKGEFNEVFAHFDQFVPTLLLVIMAAAVWVAWYIVAIIIGPIWAIGPLLMLLLSLVVFPSLGMVLVLSVGFVVDRKMGPVDAVKRAIGGLLTNPVMNWLYAVVVGILACLGTIVMFPVNMFLVPAFIGLSAFLVVILGFFIFVLNVALNLLTAPVGAIGMTIAYAELSQQEPGKIKADKKTLQTAGLVVACVFGVLLIVGLVARFGFGRGYYGPWLGARAVFGNRSGLGLGGHRDRVTVNTGEGTVSIGEGLPKDFPRDVPVYPGAKVGGTLAGSGKDSQGSTTTFTTRDKPDQIYDFYSQKLQAQGWTVAQTFLGATYQKDKRAVMVMASETNGETSIVLTVTEEK